MGWMLVLVGVVVGCGGSPKPAEPAAPPPATPAARPELAKADDPTACEIVAAHFYKLNVASKMNPPSWVPDLMTRHCLLDGWTYDVRKCMASSQDGYELSDCCRQWTADQAQRVNDDLTAKGVVLVLVNPAPSNER